MSQSTVSKKRNYEIDMCNGPILSKILLFSLPLMLSSVLQLLFNAADIIVVGRFAGDDSLAAVGSTTSLVNLLTNLFIGLSIGANVLTARCYGAGRKRDLRETVHTAMTLSLISGLLLAVIGVFGAGKILVLMQTPDEVVGLATVYLRILFLGMPAMMIYNFGSAILRAVGDTKRPLYFLAAAGVVNVLLNLFFVIVLKMNVAGVATATALSQCLSAGLVIWCLTHERRGLRLYLNKLGIHKDKLKRIMEIGIPAGMQGMLFSLSNVVIQSSINTFGNVVVAGNSAASNIEGFVFVAMNSFYQAAITFMSQNLGAGRYESLGKITSRAVICVLVTGLVGGNLAYFFGPQLLGLYSNSAAVIEAGMVRLSYIAVTYALCGLMDTMVGALRGLGYSVIPTVASLIGACGLRIVWIMIVFPIPQFHTIEMIYISYPATWIITNIAHITVYIYAMKKLKPFIQKRKEQLALEREAA